MMGQYFLGLCAVLLLSVAVGLPVDNEKPATDVIFALESYVSWMELVSVQFADEDITPAKMMQFQADGEDVHKALFDALGAQIEDKKDFNEVSKSVLELIESELLETRIDTEKVVGLVFADSIVGGQGARLSVSSRLFQQLAVRLRASLYLAKEDLNTDILQTILEEAGAAEISFDTMVESFALVEKLTEEVITEGAKRQKRQVNRNLNLGGGFSTNGSRLNWNRGRTSAHVTPHFSLRPKPQFHGATGGFNHNFRNGRGSVFGSGTVNNRGRLTGANVGIRINF